MERLKRQTTPLLQQARQKMCPYGMIGHEVNVYQG